jgi:hypothetical protein
MMNKSGSNNPDAMGYVDKALKKSKLRMQITPFGAYYFYIHMSSVRALLVTIGCPMNPCYIGDSENVEDNPWMRLIGDKVLAEDTGLVGAVWDKEEEQVPTNITAKATLSNIITAIQDDLTESRSVMTCNTTILNEELELTCNPISIQEHAAQMQQSELQLRRKEVALRKEMVMSQTL